MGDGNENCPESTSRIQMNRTLNVVCGRKDREVFGESQIPGWRGRKA